MNIFFLDKNPKQCAIYHCDKHVVKMIVESAQLLSTAHHLLSGKNYPFLSKLYKPTHINHPCSKWVRESHKNYLWTYRLLIELCQEYTHRYGKIHKTDEKLSDLLSYLPISIPVGPRTRPARAMPTKYHHEDVVKAYRAYYCNEKAHIAIWTNRPIPRWFSEGVNDAN